MISSKIEHIAIFGMGLGIILTGCGSNGQITTSTIEEQNEQIEDSIENNQEDMSGEGEQEMQEEVNDAESTKEASREIFAMDTYITVSAYGQHADEAVAAAVVEIERLDNLLSVGNEAGEVAMLNQNKGGTLSRDTQYLLERSLELWDSTDGAFDVAIYPIMEAWGFTTGEFQVPDEATLHSLLPVIDASKIQYDAVQGKVTYEDNYGDHQMAIDFGGIAKGYTSARIMDIYREYDVTCGLVNLGGNVQSYKTKVDGSMWRVAIQSPKEDGTYLGVLSTYDQAVITSGGYERYFKQDGITYHHIIDPKTGYPANNGLTSVTIVSADGTLADGLSTSLFIMGKDKAEAYWREHADEFDAIMLTDDNMLYITEGIAEQFSSDLQYQVIDK